MQELIGFERATYPFKPPFGYRVEPRQRTNEPHPKYFKPLKRMFEVFATGRYTLAAIQLEFEKAGLVGPRTQKAPPISSIHNLLKNPFYYGVFVYNGVMHQGVHAPLVSKETWDKVQAARIAVAKPRKKRNDKGFVFLNFARCGYCGLCITGERHTKKKSGKRYFYYRCTHKHRSKICEGRTYLREEAFAGEVRRNTALIVLPDEWKERFLAKVETWEEQGAAAKQTRTSALKATVGDLRSRIDRLNTAFTEGAIDVQEFKELKNPLVSQKVQVEGQITDLEARRTNRLEPLRNWILTANAVGNSVSEDDLKEMRSSLEKAGSNRILCAQTLTVSFIKPWDSLAQTVESSFADNEFTHVSEKWWR